MGYLLAFDTETADLFHTRICAVGMVKIEGGQVTAFWDELIDPECRFCERNIATHHIWPSMVRGKPNFKAFWAKYGDLFLNAEALIAHGAGSDLSALSKVMQAYRIPRTVVPFFDTKTLSERCFPELGRYGLEDLSAHFEIELDHHEAGSDTKACAAIFCLMQSRGLLKGIAPARYDLGIDRLKKGFVPEFIESCTGDLNDLLEILTRIEAKGALDDAEFSLLKRWIAEHPQFSGQFPYDCIQKALACDPKEDQSDEALREKLFPICKSCIDPLAFLPEVREIPFLGRHFCLTGEFDCGPKEEVQRKIEARGGAVTKNLLPETDCLVIGAQGSPRWAYGRYGSKLKQAREWQLQGRKICIVSEKAFWEALKKTEPVEETVPENAQAMKALFMKRDAHLPPVEAGEEEVEERAKAPSLQAEALKAMFAKRDAQTKTE